jgi:excisionase family DNA binding protein
MPKSKRGERITLDDELLTPAEVQQILRCGERTLQRYALDGTIPSIAIKQGRAKKTYRFPRRQLEDWLNERAAVSA